MTPLTIVSKNDTSDNAHGDRFETITATPFVAMRCSLARVELHELEALYMPKIIALDVTLSTAQLTLLSNARRLHEAAHTAAELKLGSDAAPLNDIISKLVWTAFVVFELTLGYLAMAAITL